MNNRAILEGGWKLVATQQGDWEACRCAEDRTSSNDLSGIVPERVASIFGAWDDWSDRVGVRRQA